MASQEQVLSYWFGTLDSTGFASESMKKKWWQGSDETDIEITHQFGESVQSALKQSLEHWRSTAKGQLALIILLDQFTRNIFRGTERAFSGDALALDVCKQGLSEKKDLELATEERVFFYMPLEHSEDIEDQNLCIRLLHGVKKSCNEQNHAALDNYISFAESHKDIIAKFGRFPHRNDALKRTNTVEEQAYLNGDHTRFGQ